MNISKLATVLLFAFFSMLCAGQNCNYSKKMLKQANKHFEEEKILKATNIEILAKSFTTNILTHFLKSENDHYLSLSLVRGGRRSFLINLKDTNPIVLRFENDSTITLYPNLLIPPSNMGFSQAISRAYYKLSKENLELLSSNRILYSKIYFSSDSDFSSQRNVSTDDLGTFMQFEIEKKDRQTSCIQNVKCILL